MLCYITLQILIPHFNYGRAFFITNPIRDNADSELLIWRKQKSNMKLTELVSIVRVLLMPRYIAILSNEAHSSVPTKSESAAILLLHKP